MQNKEGGFPSGKRGYLERKIAVRDLKFERFLIVCEGEKTEPNYFKSFPIPEEWLDIYGIGDNTLGIVRKALLLKKEGNYDQVWCVFDRDSFPAQKFNRAIELAGKNNINIAYSNEGFEIWYLLHFNFYDTAIPRREYKRMLSQLLDHRYQKNSETIYEELKNRQADAIRNAKKLLAQYPSPHPVRDNPSTTVHLLVEQLNRFITQ
ncbi:rloB-like family protein [Lyngbya aestuarii BL J]|uniref:RloB-like family protein n=1 Tax=Lyngbya aestuarii BL J TaxID=1348334 RepID=U7QRS2_9CYAN|nr:RloB family protein [Lyngbya aestuarii]ERT09111.1 rloB-like family protein [Lyngbya aestuarii BL J]